jgi:Kef-type K+ transport system membrane component KefB
MTPARREPGREFLFFPTSLRVCRHVNGGAKVDANVWLVASVWMGLALLASIISIRVGISVALIEIAVGILAGNLFGIRSAPWIDFLATFGSGLLTFLAGAEIDPASLRRHLKPALTIGAVSFLVPFIAAGAFAYWVARWELHASYIAGIALSTTSVAVVYAVMIETGLSRTELGKLILAACFVTDFGTVLALGIIFANFNGWLALFVAVTAIVLWYLPRLTRFVIRSVGHRVSEPEVKFVFLILFLLGGLAKVAQSEAVLIVAFLFVKMTSKFVGVLPLTALFKFGRKDGAYTTLLMSTGLTFGTISALFGLTNKIITQGQYTILVTTVIGSAIVPTVLAQRFFQPSGPYFETTEEDIESMNPPEEEELLASGNA